MPGIRLRTAPATACAWTWTHSDHLHSATVITDASGADVRRLAYAAFGAPVENTGSGDAPTYTYTAKEADASGLMYYGARYYDPALARFISADTLDDVGPQGLNRYSYALNNPIRYNDPTGHAVIAPVDIGGIIETNKNIRRYVDFLPDILLDSYLPVTVEDLESMYADQLLGLAIPLSGPGKKAAEEIVEGVVEKGKKVVKDVLEEGVEHGGDEILEGASKKAIPGAKRLSAAEQATAKKLMKQTGLALKESAHVGAEYVDELGRTYDALGTPKAS